MGAIADFVSDVVGAAVDFVVDQVEFVWDSIVEPQLEFVLSLFGIEDEDVFMVNKSSTLVFGDNDIDVVHQANVKAVMSMVLEGGSFFPWYIQYTRLTKAQISAYYRYGKTEKYIYALPEMKISGGEINFTAIEDALAIEIGVPCTYLNVSTLHPDDKTYFKNKFQATPYFYIPSLNTLTFIDPYGVSWDDYKFKSVFFNGGTGNFEITVARIAEEALFWIEGPVSIVEGDSATYRITCNRTLPVGESVDINLVYTGTAPGTEYTAVPTATITAGNTYVDIIITTNEDAVAQGNRTIIVTIDSITNTNAVFETVGIYTLDHVITTITDDEGIILTTPSVLTTEVSGTAIIPVKLENAAAAAFSVDYEMTNGTAIGGLDFDSTPGTLNFAGTAGEIQNISIPINTDSADDNETFTVSFLNCSDPLVDISYICTVTITDNSYYYPIASTAEINDIIIETNYIKEHSSIVKYHKNSDPSSYWFYWIYQTSLGTYPDIDPKASGVTTLDMLPIAILRRDGVDVNDNTASEEYKTTKRLINKLGLNIDDLITNAHDNPDYDANVTEYFFNFAICPNSEVEIVSKALWLTFYSLVVTEGLSSSADQFNATLIEETINNAMVWTHHSHTAGLIGTLPNGQEFFHEQEFVSEISVWDPVLEENVITQEAGSNLYIRYQVAIGVYDELLIQNLNALTAIKKVGSVGMVTQKLGDDIFTIPMSHFILQQMNHTEQMQLYQYMFRLDAYTAQLIHLDWYETQGFANLFEFAMIVITVVSLGTASGPLAVLQTLLVNYLVIELVIYLAEVTGNATFAALVGMVAMIALGGFGPSFDIGSAEALLRASTNFADNLTAAYNSEAQGLREDLEELNAQAEARMEEIREANPESSPITAEFLVALNSVDTTVFPAIKAQYDFDLLYNYDRLIADYCSLQLRTGVT